MLTARLRYWLKFLGNMSDIVAAVRRSGDAAFPLRTRCGIIGVGIFWRPPTSTCCRLLFERLSKIRQQIFSRFNPY
jgi:hypothetical protein